MHTAVITELGHLSASTRYRAELHLERLRERVGSIDVRLASDNPHRRPGTSGQLRYFVTHGARYIRRRAELASALDECDAVFVQRGCYPMGPGAVARPLEDFEGTVVFDLDDDVFSPSSGGHVRRWLYGPQQSLRVFARADYVIVSTPALRDRLPKTQAEIVVLPTVLDVTPYSMAAHGSSPARLCWAGSPGNLRYLDTIRPALERVSDTVGLEVICSQPWSGPASFRPWSLRDEFGSFAEYSIGIMPLDDSRHAVAKAGFKLLQYMAAGLPVVASPVGINTKLVSESGAGFLAVSLSDWRNALLRLSADSGLRIEMGLRGRDYVSAYSDLDGQADIIARLLTSPRRIG